MTTESSETSSLYGRSKRVADVLKKATNLLVKKKKLKCKRLTKVKFVDRGRKGGEISLRNSYIERKSGEGKEDIETKT